MPRYEIRLAPIGAPRVERPIVVEVANDTRAMFEAAHLVTATHHAEVWEAGRFVGVVPATAQPD